MATDYGQLWESALQTIRQKLNNEDEFNNWFRPVVYESFSTSDHVLVLKVPSASHNEYIEKNHLRLLAEVLIPIFGKKVRLIYRIMVDQQNNQSVTEAQENELVQARKNASQKQSNLPPIDAQLDPRMNFGSFIEGDSNKFSRTVAINIAEHPKTNKFNPMFVFGPSGCGKTHLINAIGMRAKDIYPNLRVLYVSARTFQQQFTTATTQNKVNDFIAFYQTIDMLIVDDIQEWISVEKTQLAFFHIFDFLFRQQKRIILSSDRSPAQLRGMHERLITRFAWGVTTEVEKPNVQLCKDILKSKVSRDGLTISDEVLEYIATTVNGSVRELQGVINSLMAYSIVADTDIDMRLTEKVVKRIIHISDEPVNLDHIFDAVCEHCHVTPQDINGKSRKKEFTQARQIAMYLASRHTTLTSPRIGILIGGRDHTTVLHSCRKIEKEIKKNQDLKLLVDKIEKEIKERR